MKTWTVLIAFSAAVFFTWAGFESLPAQGKVDFSREVRPILSENCFNCHGPDSSGRKADLRLDIRGPSTLAAIVPGDPSKSPLLERVTSRESDEVMPPLDSGKSLARAEIEILRKWIEDGADYEVHWSFRPIEKPEPPNLKENLPGLTEIDRFLLSGLQKKSLSFSPKPDREKLIRRAAFDLTGLPPKWAEVEAFVNDPDTDERAFAKIIDRYLAAPQYGERWGRHWLDVARYADTHGGSAIGFTRFAFSYTYRDYVISAFNEDKPYNRFLMEQIAADQLGLKENDPARAALGFLTVGRQFRNRHDLLDDQIDVITRGLMGLSAACARCHDHKFDPIPATDYYALHAALSASRVPEDLPLVGEPEVAASYATALRKNEQLRNDIVREQGDVFRGRLRQQIGMYLRELAIGTPEQDTSTRFLSYRTEDLRPDVLERWRAYLKTMDGNDPVFGPWHRLADVDPDQFAKECQDLAELLTKENGDPKKFANEHNIAVAAPRWNPRVLDALREKKPNSFVEVAEVYGEVFGNAHRQWQEALLEASLEAAPGGELRSDHDPKHRVVNSAIERQLRRHLYDPESPTSVPMSARLNQWMLNRGIRDRVRGTLTAIDRLNLSPRAPPRAMQLIESDQIGESFVFLRGNPVSRGEKVEPHFLSVLSPGKPVVFKPGELRLGLARAVVDRNNPLTRRVIVNWVWQHHFGRGLVGTPDDFGALGKPPTYPELLDYLAETFLEEDWSLKALHRRIMNSAVYQQGSQENQMSRLKDPGNELLWRMPPRKLKLEAMRDSLLAVSGELKADETGGRPFEETASKTVPRRSVYAFVNRDIVSPLASNFDGANPSSCTMERPETMAPQQTLFALNSEFIQKRARVLLDLSVVENIAGAERVKLIYRKVYSRDPEIDEIETALTYIQSQPQTREAWIQLTHALLASNEFHFID